MECETFKTSGFQKKIRNNFTNRLTKKHSAFTNKYNCQKYRK